MKTTIELDDDLVRRAKQEASRQGVPLRKLVEDALRASLLPQKRGRGRYRLEAPVVTGTAPPAVDIADRDALYDLMERGDRR
jgi:Arc/MetJ family transcription regulator